MVEKDNYNGQFVFGLDIGTRSIVGTIGYKVGTNRFIVEAQIIREHETRTMLEGQIHDIGKVARSIAQIKKELEEKTSRKLTEVCIAAAGRVLKTVTCRVDHLFSSETVVSKEHIYSLDMLGVEKAFIQMRENKTKDSSPYFCVGYSVVNYYLNNYAIKNLKGYKANKISVELIATFLPDEVVDGLYSAVEIAGLKVANLTLEPIAAMNVAIPENLRLLNLALVDVGAGTSDIAIAKDGSIIAFGMIPFAGDAITETIAKKYLTDFQTAEGIKTGILKKKSVTFKDIMGIPHNVSAKEVTEEAKETVKGITKCIADKMIELNGGKTVSAVFVVGGGGKIKGFVEGLSKCLGLPLERVAIRGEEVLNDVELLQSDIKKDSILVTPIGICLNYYEQKNNFIYVTLNNEQVKLYDNSKLTITDAVLQQGLPNHYLFPKRGKTLHFTVNGKKRMIRGEQGEAAVIRLNGNVVGMNALIRSHDTIEIKESTSGADAGQVMGKLTEYRDTICFTFNDKAITCPKFATVNDEVVSGYYEIQDGDNVKILDYYTLEQVLIFLDMKDVRNVFVNHQPANPQTKVYDKFSITCVLEENGTKEVNEKETVPKKNGNELKIPEESGITVTVNKETVILTGKNKYILVDVLDFYSFDLNPGLTHRLVIEVNGEKADFTTTLADGDFIQMYWGS